MFRVDFERVGSVRRSAGKGYPGLQDTLLICSSFKWLIRPFFRCQPILACGIQLQGEHHPGRPVRVPDEHRVDQSRAHWSRLVGEWLPREQNWFQPGSSQGGFAKLSVYGEESKGRFAGL